MRNTDGMLCTLKSDLFKLKKHKSVWIGFAVMFVIMLLAYCVYWIGGDFLDAFLNPDDVASAELKNQFSNLSLTLLADHADTCALSLFVMIITCLFVGKDFSNGAMRLSVSRGANRVQAYFSKWITLALLTVVYSVFSLVICGIFSAFKPFTEPFTAQTFGLLMRCFFLLLICNLSTMSIVLALAFLLRSSGASIGVTVGIYIAFSIVISLISTIGNLGADTDWVYFMPLQQNSIAGSMADYSTTEICAVAIMPLFYGVVSTVIGLLTFLKRDIK